MKRIIDTFSMCGKELPIDRLIPEAEDVRKVLPRRSAEKAIELMSCEEEFIREHLRIGSTPPTKVKVVRTPWRQKILQTAIYRIFKEVNICL